MSLPIFFQEMKDAANEESRPEDELEVKFIDCYKGMV
jgi:hypothetical protein